MARPIPDMTADEVINFVCRIKFKESKSCWIFNNGKSYGQFYVDGKCFPAHRISLFLFGGFDPMEKMVCHKCDNPPCVNPQHLYAGTARDNAVDASHRNRYPKGQKVLRAKYLKESLHSDFIKAAERDLGA